jgi:hypothetical protein
MAGSRSLSSVFLQLKTPHFKAWKYLEEFVFSWLLTPWRPWFNSTDQLRRQPVHCPLQDSSTCTSGVFLSVLTKITENNANKFAFTHRSFISSAKSTKTLI